jgi:hypothetical protein
MPTLIRLFIVLVILAVLAFAGMVALAVFVDPGEKDITIRIPSRELVPPSAAPAAGDPLGLNELPAPVGVVPPESSAAASSAPPAATLDLNDDGDTGSDIVTLQPGGDE